MRFMWKNITRIVRAIDPRILIVYYHDDLCCQHHIRLVLNRKIIDVIVKDETIKADGYIDWMVEEIRNVARKLSADSIPDLI